MIETRCPACQATRDCLCKCRERIRLVAREVDAMEAVVEAARLVPGGPLSLALAAYDDAVAARKAAP